MAESKTLVIPGNIRELIFTEAAARKLPGEVPLGIFGAENIGNPDLDPTLKSPKGARGPWQLTPGAVKDTGRDPAKFNYNNLVESTKAALDYIKLLYDQFDGDAVLTIAAYNAGAGRIREIVAAGGGPENLPDETQNYLVNGDRFSEGYLTRPSGKATATGEVAPEATVRQPQPVQEPQPQPSRPTTQSLPPAVAQKYGNTTAGAGIVYDNIVKPMLNFPRQVLTQVGAPAMGFVREHWPEGLGTPPPAITPEPIGFTDAVNFGTGVLPITRTGAAIGRVGNAAISGGVGVLNAAKEQAAKKAAEQGVDFATLGTGEQTSLIVDQLLTDGFSEYIEPLVISAGAGWVFGGSSYEKPLLGKKGLSVGPAYGRDEAIALADAPLRQHDEALLFNREQMIADDADVMARKAWERQANQSRAQNLSAAVSYAAELQATIQANAEDAAVYAQRFGKQEARIAAAEARTGLKRLPQGAFKEGGQEVWAPERVEAFQVMRNRMKQEFAIPDSNPAEPIFAELTSRYGARQLDEEAVEQFNKGMQPFLTRSKEHNLFRSDIEFYARPLEDPENVYPMINKLERKARNTQDPAKRAQLVARAQEERAKLVPPTVDTLLTRAQAIDEFRRSKVFKDATPSQRGILADMSHTLRSAADEEGGGLVEQALSPGEAALWRKGNEMTRQYREDERALDLISDAFAASKNGASQIRNTLVKDEKFLRAKYGDENYDSLLQLAEDIDTLAMKIPDAPKARALPGAPTMNKIGEPPPPTAKPFKPIVPVEVAKAVEKARKKISEGGRSGTARRFGHLVTMLARPVHHGARGTIAGLGAAGVGGALGFSAQGASIAGLSMSAMTLLLTSRVARESFHKMAKHMDNMTSAPFLKAAARFAVAAQVQQSFGEPNPASIGPPSPAAAGPPTPPDLKLRVPNLPMATRQTGRVPAPPPIVSTPGAPL